MKGVKYVGPLKCYSGYGEAARNYVLALHRAGIPVTTQTRRFDVDAPEVGTDEERRLLNSLEGKQVDYEIVIVHLTPDLVPQYIGKEPEKYFVNYTVWETDKLHPMWVDSCNKSQEIWVPSDWNVEVFKRSGVEVPVHKIRHGLSKPTGALDEFAVDGLDKENTYLFYSIFQWNSRKNPEGLLRAYFNAFQRSDNVALLLKTYLGSGVNHHEEQSILRKYVSDIKRDMGFKADNFPRVLLTSTRLTTEQLWSLHNYADAYVSLHHAEGFGLPLAEAGLVGNPVIATGMGGNMEFMSVDNSYPVEHTWDYLAGMSTFNRWYLGDQSWAYPSLKHASLMMRSVYNDRELAAGKASRLKSKIEAEFSWDAAVEPMISRIKDINNG